MMVFSVLFSGVAAGLSVAAGLMLRAAWRASALAGLAGFGGLGLFLLALAVGFFTAGL